MTSRADRVRAILRDIGFRLGSNDQNEAKLKKFLDDNGFRGYNNINIIKNWYDNLKNNYKRMILRHFKVELTDDDDLDSKLNELLRDQHLRVQDPTLGWMIKWVERTKAEEKSNKEFIKAMMRMTTPEVRLQRPHDERLLDYEWRNLMNMSTPDTRLQTPHDERHKRYVNRITRNRLHGDIDPELSKEGTKFIENHNFRDLYNGDECILLFETANEIKFRKCLHQASYKADQVKVDDKNAYRNYYLNKLTTIDKVLDLLDRIIKECTLPFKIMCDCGFIVEDSTNNEYTRMPPKEDEVERSVPFTITKNTDMETYKHYIYSFISEKMEKIHISSSHRYVAIYGFLFKVVKLTKAGAKFKTDGYQFLNKFRCVRIVYDNYNTCIFNSCYHHQSKLARRG